MSITAIEALNDILAIEPSVSTQIITTSPVAIYADGLEDSEFIQVHRLGPNGAVSQLTNEKGLVRLSKKPNVVYLPIFGTFQLSKTASVSAPFVGYEEQ